MNETNFVFLRSYLSLFPTIPTAKESQAAWIRIDGKFGTSVHVCSSQIALGALAIDYGVINKNASKKQVQDAG